MKQWIFVGAVVLGLVAGAWGLTKYGNRHLTVEVGRAAPDFTAQNLRTQEAFSLRDQYRNQVVLVNLWATWCLPCRKEMPDMEQLYRELGPHGFRIAAVSVDEGDLKGVLSFADEYDLTFDILHDGDGSVQKAFQTIMFPESFLIDREGVVVKKVLGEHPWSSDANRRLVAELLGIELGTPAPATPAGSSGG
ncbi:MAG: TlpA family protein disulfide reductase [Gemmatimonadales bacterium]|nr:TlpA family protein disulfide reductase [Gemmatimonadales bacterium]